MKVEGFGGVDVDEREQAASEVGKPAAQAPPSAADPRSRV
jgi:hypothetical protein